MRTTIVLLFAFAFNAFAQQATHLEPQVFVTAIDVVADVRDASGKLPPGLTAADFVILEEGVARPIIGVDYLRMDSPIGAVESGAAPAAVTPPAPSEQRAPWQVVLYFESALSNGMSRRRTAEQLIKQTDEMVQMGRVDVIFADPTPVALVRNSRDPVAIREALQKVVASTGINQLARHRREFMLDVAGVSSLSA